MKIYAIAYQWYYSSSLYLDIYYADSKEEALVRILWTILEVDSFSRQEAEKLFSKGLEAISSKFEDLRINYEIKEII